MSIAYHVYSNGGLPGAPIDYTTPIATVTGTSWTSTALGPNRTYLFGVRAYDTISGLEESNVDAVVTITTDASGNDVSLVPKPPLHLTVRPIAAGGLRVEWTWPHNIRSSPTPVGFRVYAGAAPGPNYGTPAATVAYQPGALHYSAVLAGRTGTVYIAVRAYNAVGEEANTTVVSATAQTSAPLSAIAATITGTSQVGV